MHLEISLVIHCTASVHLKNSRVHVINLICTGFLPRERCYQVTLKHPFWPKWIRLLHHWSPWRGHLAKSHLAHGGSARREGFLSLGLQALAFHLRTSLYLPNGGIRKETLWYVMQLAQSEGSLLSKRTQHFILLRRNWIAQIGCS